MVSDIAIEAVLSAKESISDKMKDISVFTEDAAESMDNASEEASKLSSSFTTVSAASESAEDAIEETDDALEDLNRTFTAVQANAAGTAAAIQAIGTTDLSDISTDPEALESFTRKTLPRDLLESEDFKRRLSEGIDVDFGGSEKRAVGSAIGTVRGDKDRSATIGNIASQLASKKRVSQSEAEIIREIRDAAGEAGIAMGILEKQIDDVEDELDETSASAIGMSASLGSMNSLLASSIVGFSTADKSLEELEDEINDVTRSLLALGPAFSSVSANLGPFNVALSNLLITIPSIIAVVGPLIAVFSALAVTAGGAIAALGAFAAIGFLGVLDQMEQQFAGINNKMDALSALGEGVGQALSDAVAPLRNVEFMGMSGIDFVFRLIRDFVTIVQIASEIFANLLSMSEVESFFKRIEGALLGTSDAARSTTSMMTAMEDATEKVLPVITDLLVFLITQLPNAIQFVADTTDNVDESMANLANSVLELSVVLINIGEALINTVIPPLSTLIELLAVGLAVITTFLNMFGPAGDMLLEFGLIALTTATVMAKLNSVINVTAEAIASYTTVAGTASLTTAKVQQKMSLMAITALKAAAAFGVMIFGLVLVKKGLENVADALGISIDIFGILGNAINAIIQPFAKVINAFGKIFGQSKAASSVMQLFVGLLQIVIGSFLALAGASFTAQFALAGYGAIMSAVEGTTLGAIVTTNSLTASISALNVALGGVAALLIMLGSALALGTLELEQFGAAGRFVKDILQQVGNAIGVSAETLESLIGVVIAAAGAFIALKVAGLTSIGAISAALTATGWGAILIGIGLAILFLINQFDAIVGIVQDVVSWFDSLGIVGKAAIIGMLAKISPLLAGLLALRELLGPIHDLFKGLLDFVTGIFEKAMDLIDGVKDVKDSEVTQENKTVGRTGTVRTLQGTAPTLPDGNTGGNEFGREINTGSPDRSAGGTSTEIYMTVNSRNSEDSEREKFDQSRRIAREIDKKQNTQPR